MKSFDMSWRGYCQGSGMEWIGLERYGGLIVRRGIR